MHLFSKLFASPFLFEKFKPAAARALSVLGMIGVLLAGSPSRAQGSASGTISGVVTGPDGKPVAGAAAELTNRIGSQRYAAVTAADGSFRLLNIPFDGYRLEIVAAGLSVYHADLDIHAALPERLVIRMKPGDEVVTVEARRKLVEEHPGSHYDVSRSTIENSPAAVQSRAMESILLTTPGFIQDENGRFHFRGSHGQVMFNIDGVPVTDQVQSTFSNSLDPATVESMSVETGGISAEYGGKPVAVVNLTSRSGLGLNGFDGDIYFGGSRFGTAEAGFSVRGGNDRFGAYTGGAASQSDRFLDPVNFDNLHNHGRTSRISTRFDWALGGSDSLRVSFSRGHTRRDVVNLASQELAGQNQRITNDDFNASLGWVHLFGDNRSLDATLFYRHAASKLHPTQPLGDGFAAGGPDFPIYARQDRSLDNQGALVAFTQRKTLGESGKNIFKAGLQYVRYPIKEQFEFGITDDGAVTDPADPLYPYTPSGGGTIFRYSDAITPTFASAFVQDNLEIGAWNFALGLRYDSYKQRRFTQSELQPRVGIAYNIYATGTVFRASYDRLMITPENENLALSTSQQAWDLGPGAGTPVPPLAAEVQNSYLIGVEQQLGSKVRIVADYWKRSGRNAADNEQFLNTGILFPIAADRGRFKGYDLRLETVPIHGWSGYLSAGHTEAIFVAPTVGGLQLESPEAAPGESFLIDHDQKLSAQAGVRFEHGGFSGQVSARYDSGLVAGDPADAAGNPDLEFGIAYVRFDSSDNVFRVKSRTVFNASFGQRFNLTPRSALYFNLDILNVTDEKALYNFLSVFGGTHVIPPRTWAGRIKVKF